MTLDIQPIAYYLQSKTSGNSNILPWNDKQKTVIVVPYKLMSEQDAQKLAEARKGEIIQRFWDLREKAEKAGIPADYVTNIYTNDMDNEELLNILKTVKISKNCLKYKLCGHDVTAIFDNSGSDIPSKLVIEKGDDKYISTYLGVNYEMQDSEGNKLVLDDAFQEEHEYSTPEGILKNVIIINSENKKWRIGEKVSEKCYDPEGKDTQWGDFYRYAHECQNLELHNGLIGIWWAEHIKCAKKGN